MKAWERKAKQTLDTGVAADRARLETYFNRLIADWLPELAPNWHITIRYEYSGTDDACHDDAATCKHGFVTVADPSYLRASIVGMIPVPGEYTFTELKVTSIHELLHITMSYMFVIARNELPSRLIHMYKIHGEAVIETLARLIVRLDSGCFGDAKILTA